MDQIFSHAAGHTGVSVSDMTVLRAESVTWPDGSLGCPEPGMQYTQALVPGYWVEIAVGDEVRIGRDDPIGYRQPGVRWIVEMAESDIVGFGQSGFDAGVQIILA